MKAPELWHVAFNNGTVLDVHVRTAGPDDGDPPDFAAVVVDRPGADNNATGDTGEGITRFDAVVSVVDTGAIDDGTYVVAVWRDGARDDDGRVLQLWQPIYADAPPGPVDTSKFKITVGVIEPTLRELQERASWGSQTYDTKFNADPRPHKDMAHAVQHILKAAGQLAGVLDDLDHGERTAPTLHGTTWRALADVVICALRAANTFPLVAIDMQTAVPARMDMKGMGAPTGACPACKGTGRVDAWDPPGTMMECSACGGRGQREAAALSPADAAREVDEATVALTAAGEEVLALRQLLRELLADTRDYLGFAWQERIRAALGEEAR